MKQAREYESWRSVSSSCTAAEQDLLVGDEAGQAHAVDAHAVDVEAARRRVAGDAGDAASPGRPP